MLLYRVRRVVFALTIAATAVAIIGVWIARIGIIQSGADRAHIDTLLATAVQTTSAAGGITLALVFITAQTSAAKASVVRELYRSVDIYVLSGLFIVTLILGYAALVPVGPPRDQRLADTVLILSGAVVLLVTPVLMLQIENFNPAVLAGKLAERISPRAAADYGLTDVRQIGSDLSYRLNIVGLRPGKFDPLRPLHEVLMECVNARDRVLLGKLLRQLVRPIARVYGAPWDSSGLRAPRCAPPRFWRRWLSARYTPEQQGHVTLMILHYGVKRGRNLKTEWGERDIGRHGLITTFGDLLRALAPVHHVSVTAALRMTLYATLHIAEYYKEVRPFGRFEPLRDYFETANCLWRMDKHAEALLCVDVLGWIAARTTQLREERCPGATEVLLNTLKTRFNAANARAASEPEWLPGDGREDPWRNWLGQ